ncbi:MAG: hypothetical protein A4E34_00840 [Methanoregula sp. PtaU1.Bin006]|nr:MAG: hypothetical protein A4E33_02004 [Methanoregula sp. PtaB.Bin085]OPY35312.1 MAG: hypothetical protein A4E34_00840 [Methanoregula sp. PtaU1.Bin006]
MQRNRKRSRHNREQGWHKGGNNYFSLWRNRTYNALSGFVKVTPSLPQRGRQPKGASPLDHRFPS